MPPIDNVTCPFCSLVCDDLRVSVQAGDARAEAGGCMRSSESYARLAAAGATARPRLRGAEASLQDALAAAASMLAGSRRPVFGGLATDVAGMRAALRLAERVGAVVTPLNGDIVWRNLAVLQDTGWINATYSEVRNRADLVVCVGTDAVSRAPRFVDRILRPAQTLFSDAPPQRNVVMLGARAPAEFSADGVAPEVLNCPNEALGEVLGALHALVQGLPVAAESVAGVPMVVLASLAERLKTARYAVIVWAAVDFPFAHAELAVQTLCSLVRNLNAKTRCLGLPLGGPDGDMTAQQVLTWQTGYPLGVSYADGTPRFDPRRHTLRGALGEGADALLWLSALHPDAAPPPTGLPTVVLGSAGLRLEAEPDVFIPVGTPGVHHAGHFFRGDGVVALPLRGVVPPTLPSAAGVLDAIGAALPDTSAATAREAAACA